MSIDTHDLASLTAVIAAGIMAATSAIDGAISKLHRRTEQLRTANRSLAAHYTALEKFVSDPASPLSLCNFIVTYSDAIGNESVACQIVRRFCEDEPVKQATGHALEVIQELDRLRNSRKDLVSEFDIAVGAGITAMFLRWDLTAAMFEQAAARFTANPGREMAVAAKIVKTETRPRQENHHHGADNLVAA